MTGCTHSLLEVSTDAAGRALHPLDVATGATLVLCLEASAERTERAEALARVRGARRLQAYAFALEQRAMLDAAGTSEQVQVRELHGRNVAVRDEVIAELALTTRRTEAEVRRDLNTARTLEASLPAVRDALSEGRIDPAKATFIAITAQRLPEEKRTELEAPLLKAAAAQNLREFKETAEQSVRDVDPDGRRERAARAARKRAVLVMGDHDGNALLYGRLAAIDAHACMRVIDDIVSSRRERVMAAHDAAGLERPTTSMLRADVLVERLLGRPGLFSSDDGHTAATGSHSVRTEVQVRVDLATLTGLQDEAALVDGSLSADIVALRTWLADCGDVRFRRLIVEPLSGRLLECGESAYTPSAALTRFVVARDGTCVWSGCSEPAVDCDLDHIEPWQRGGETVAANLQSLCRPHHLLKTHAGYEFVQDDRGEWALVTPAGQRVAVRNASTDPPDG